MMPVLQNGNSISKSDWRAWALNIAILIIAGLATIGIGHITLSLNTMDLKMEKIMEHNHTQDLCIRELQINQQERMRRDEVRKYERNK